MHETVSISAKFVDYKSGKSKKGTDYHILTLSDGLRSASSFLKEPIDTHGCVEGDDVTVEFTVGIDYNNRWDVQVVSLERA